MVRLKVLDWWQAKFRAEAALLPSLSLFRSEFMSLQRTHPIWLSAGCNPYEVKKATVQARMLSGRYRTCWLRRHWSRGSTGHCQIPGCSDEPGTLLHIATGQCPSLAGAKSRAVLLWKDFLSTNPILLPLISDISLEDQVEVMSFLVDPTCPE